MLAGLTKVWLVHGRSLAVPSKLVALSCDPSPSSAVALAATVSSVRKSGTCLSSPARGLRVMLRLRGDWTVLIQLAARATLVPSAGEEGDIDREHRK